MIKKALFLYRQIVLFYFPNIVKLLGKSIEYKRPPTVQQKLIFTGKGKFFIGDRCKFGYILGGFNKNGCVEIQSRSLNSVIILGNNISTNNNVFICSEQFIKINDNVLIGQNVTIMDFAAHGTKPNERRNNITKGKVIINDNVWIGNNVIILKNTEIGKNSVVAAGAVVSGVFPSNVIIGGIPARVIKKIID